MKITISVNKTQNTDEVLPSVLFSIALMGQLISAAVRIDGLFIIIILALDIYSFLHYKRISKSGVLFVTGILSLSLISRLFTLQEEYETFVRYMLFFGGMATYAFMFNKDINTRIVQRACVLIGGICVILLIPRTLQIILSIGTYQQKSTDMMSLSYSILPVALFALSAVFRKEEHWVWKAVAAIIATISIYELLTIGSRGCYLCIMVFLYIEFVSGKVNNKRKNFALFIVSISVLLIAWNNIDILLVELSGKLSELHIKVYAIDKMIRYMASNTVMNGRDEIWTMAISGILEMPFGHGVGTFESIAGGRYIHNVVLQLGWEFGWLGTTIAIIFVLYASYYVVSVKCKAYNRTFFAVLFSISIVRLQVSYVFWQSFPFWMICAHIYKNISKQNYEIDNCYISA